jgi:hypothetical protein
MPMTHEAMDNARTRKTRPARPQAPHSNITQPTMYLCPSIMASNSVHGSVSNRSSWCLTIQAPMSSDHRTENSPDDQCTDHSREGTMS